MFVRNMGLLCLQDLHLAEGAYVSSTLIYITLVVIRLKINQRNNSAAEACHQRFSDLRELVVHVQNISCKLNNNK